MNRSTTGGHRRSATDKDLVHAVQKGDPKAFDALVERHKDKVYGICHGFLNETADANDMAQEVFIKAYRGISRFKFRSAFSTWLYRIAVNTCKNKIGSLEYRFRKRLHPLRSASKADPGLEIADKAASPQAQLELKERHGYVRAAIAGLPPKKRAMIILRDMQGFSYEEISRISGISLGTVKSRLARARRDLKKRLVKVL